jgi:hypothetical protein
MSYNRMRGIRMGVAVALGVQQVASLIPTHASAHTEHPDTAAHRRERTLRMHAPTHVENAMNTQQTSEVRPFYRSEAFPEDVADLVESATAIAARRQHRPHSSSRVWLLTLLPVGAVAMGTALALARLF